MRKWLIAASLAAVLPAFAAARIDLVPAAGQLAVDGAPSDLKVRNEGKNLILSVPDEMDKYRRLSFTVKSDCDDKLIIKLRSRHTVDAGKRKIPRGTYYTELRVNGENRPFNSKLLTRDPGITGGAPAALRVSFEEFFSFSIPVKKDEAITISVLHRDAGNLAVQPDVAPLGLAAFANRDFFDSVAGDGRGGWSDQGEQSIKGFDPTTASFGGMEFQVIDPQKNQGRAVLTFDSPHDRTGLKTVEVKVSGTHAHLYLLHSACWLLKDRVPVGRIRVDYADNSFSEFQVESGHDIADWGKMFAAPNAVPVYWNDFAERSRGLFLSKFQLKRTELRSIRFTALGGPVWIVVAASLSDRKLDTAQKTMRFLPPAWKKADFPALPVVKGSALDLSETFPAHISGGFGRVIVNPQGDMVFEKRPEEAVRFAGATGGFSLTALKRVLDKGGREEAHRAIDALLDKLQISGYNMLRTLNVLDLELYLDSGEDGKFHAGRLELFDYLVFGMKQRGMYLLGTLGSYHLGQIVDGETVKANRNDHKVRVFFGDPAMQKKWETVARDVLTHVNPHTGLALKDDPVMFLVEPYNEQSLAIRHLFFKRGTIRPETLTFVQKKFSAYLKEKYGTPEKLAAAWKEKVASFDEVYLFDRPTPTGAVGTDWEAFVVRTALRTGEWYRSVIRDTGYPGLIAQYNFSNAIDFTMAADAFGEATIKNIYWAHPSGFVMEPGNRVSNQSSLEASGSYWRNAASNRVSGKPLIITEYNHCFWNPYGHEAGMLVPAYSALQGFSGLTIHSAPVVAGFRPQRPFDVGSSPLMRANEFLSMMLFRRGDVAPSRNRVEVVIPRAFREKFENGTQALNSTQNLLALLGGFSLAFPELRQKEVFPNALKVAPASGAKIKDEDWFSSVENTDAGKSSLEATVEEMRRRGMLPPGNRTNIRNQVFHSDTGELEMRPAEGLLKVVTPRTEAVVLRPETGSERLDRLTIRKLTAPATVAVTALDSRPLPESSRLLLIVNTCTANSGMELSADRVTLIQPGKNPILLECLTLKAELALGGTRNYRVYPLSVNGIRRAAIPAAFEGGVLKLEIDTTELPEGPTPFFEITAD